MKKITNVKFPEIILHVYFFRNDIRKKLNIAFIYANKLLEIYDYYYIPY